MPKRMIEMILMLLIPNPRQLKMKTTTLQPSLPGENGDAEATERLEVALEPEAAKESREVLVGRWNPVQSSNYSIPRLPTLSLTGTMRKPPI
jgi:hypothetical protein